MASDDREKGGEGETPSPVMVMRVKMCCAKCEEKAREEAEEVEGVERVVTDMAADKVTVYGSADPSTLLKKMRRHLDRHATVWPSEEGPKGEDGDKPEPEEEGGYREGGRPRGLPYPDHRMVDPREMHYLEKGMEAAGIREGHPPRGLAPGPPREVVYIPVDAQDGRPVDPRTVRAVDPARMEGVEPTGPRGGGGPPVGLGPDPRGYGPPARPRGLPEPMGGGYGPRGPMGPVQDRGMGFDAFGPSDPHAPVRPMIDPRGYGPVDPRAPGGAFAPRGVPPPPEALGLRPAEPRILLDVTEELRDGSRHGMGPGPDPRMPPVGPRDFGPGGGPAHRPHVSQYSEFGRSEADPREYQPKEAYFSDYAPSQSY